MKTFIIETWGCQMNSHDSERLEGLLRGLGMDPVDESSKADLVLLNTCSVREKPVQKILSRIGELERFEHRPAIGICGCVAQQEGEKLLKRSKAVSFVLGPGQVGRVLEAVRAATQGERTLFTGFDPEEEYNFQTIFRKSSTRGMVTVMEGCEEYCTFCVVPFTRGREVSRPAEDIVQEVKGLTAVGVREIELLGQTINAYVCPNTKTTFAQLLSRVSDIQGVKRLRYVTSQPRHFGPDLIQVLSEKTNVSRYLHLPFQSGSDSILKRMNRKYTREEFLTLIEEIRSAVPDLNLSTDVIVGFPGETEEDFLQTLEILEEIRFGQVFAFAFSPRPNTPARKYPEQVDEAVKMDRLHRLFSMTDQISTELNQAMVGSVVSVLIDGFSRRTEQDWQGRGDDNRVVNFPATGREGVGDIVDVEIIRAGTHSLYGHAVGISRGPALPVMKPRPSEGAFAAGD
ncbi:MAG: tRNA (N6-isopentenyl adenosine(37)-C2)-methylthiotransferase MiaB [Acidobacteria bacterium]|nr:MAG: tRNA (N6-isopentenyl adenosine(37)-C2)-methylthiotransferase MiaB [Acidobacteriota bacterium]